MPTMRSRSKLREQLTIRMAVIISINSAFAYYIPKSIAFNNKIDLDSIYQQCQSSTTKRQVFTLQKYVTE